MFVGTAEGWAVSAVRLDGDDIADAIDFDRGDVSGIEVLLTQQLTTVTGRVTNTRGTATDEATVVMFADGAATWVPRSRFVRAVRPDRNGRFTLRGLPPARYVAIAVANLETGEEGDPALLAALSALGRKVTLGRGQSVNVELTVVTP
jgi:hypothetical protein